jgi:signal-transduction protein with cAMP-binding, CBS, and nucleotidyltransferase domain
MAKQKSTYAFIRSTDPKQVGIVTEKDFTRKVIARGYPIDNPVASIMSAPLQVDIGKSAGVRSDDDDDGRRFSARRRCGCK